MNKKNLRCIVAAGGTGGHLFPALSVVEELKRNNNDASFLFIGTKNKIEAEVIPELGYKFKTIWVSGLNRGAIIKNLLFPLKVIVSTVQSFFINLKFKPNVAIGAGAYVSGPIVWAASMLGSKIVLLEQNSYPGVTNRMLEKKADRIYISFEDSRQYFKCKDKLKLMGNPVRTTLNLIDKTEANKKLNLDSNKKTLLIIGGSLGARSINNAISKLAEKIIEKNIQVIWQTGSLYYDEFKNLENKNLIIKPFIKDMTSAYSAADLVIARAGATTISEAAYLSLPVIFIPSTNVAANHQHKNAMSLVNENAGLLIEDAKIETDLLNVIEKTIYNEKKLSELKSNINKFSKPNAAKEIAEEILKLSELRKN